MAKCTIFEIDVIQYEDTKAEGFIRLEFTGRGIQLTRMGSRFPLSGKQRQKINDALLTWGASVASGIMRDLRS